MAAERSPGRQSDLQRSSGWQSDLHGGRAISRAAERSPAMDPWANLPLEKWILCLFLILTIYNFFFGEKTDFFWYRYRYFFVENVQVAKFEFNLIQSSNSCT
jgi:hypothetical protein